MADPRHHTPRSDRPTRGGAVGVIARAKGRPLMPWQQQAVDVALEVDPGTGAYHYGIVVVTVPRQAGKTKLEGDVADHRCLTTPRGRVWLTQQTGKDASAWMRDEHFAALADAKVFGRPGSPSCKYRLSRRAGAEGVEWPGIGSTFRAFAPLRDALHGKQSDLALVDEAWSLTAEQGSDVRQAIRPTMLTRKGSQLWIVSTKGDDSSVFLDDYVQMGTESLGDPASRVCFIDYGIGDDVDAEDLAAVAAAHPAYGHTVDLAALEAAREDFGADVSGWARAYGNRETRSRTALWSVELWARAGSEARPIPARPGLAFDVSPSGHVAVAAVWDEGGDDVFGEVISPPGLTADPAAAFIAALARKFGVPVGYDTVGVQTLDLADRIATTHRGVKLVGSTTTEHAMACATLDRELRAGVFHHFRQPALDEAVEVAAKRAILDEGWVITRKGSQGTIAELVAVAVARKMLRKLPAKRSFKITVAA